MQGCSPLVETLTGAQDGTQQHDINLCLFVAQSIRSGLLVLDFEMFPHYNSQKLPGHFLTSTWVAPVRFFVALHHLCFTNQIALKRFKNSPKKNLSENKTSGSQTLTLSLLQEF